MAGFERRDGSRFVANQRARLVLGNGSQIGCRITDVSHRGALIELDGDAELPNLFQLRSLTSPFVCWVTLAWRSGRRCGLSAVGGIESWRLQSTVSGS